jgi:hypothetical protein
MRDREHGSTPAPHNAFSEDFLRRFEQHDEPPSSAEADTDGPWRVLPHLTSDGRESFGLWRLGERPEWGDAPVALFRERSTALLGALARPISGREPYFRLEKDRTDGGFPLTRQGEPLAWIEVFDEDWAALMNHLERLVRSPEALALLLVAAGPLALKRAGSILREKVEGGGF